MENSPGFCNVDEMGFPHWNGFDFFRWYALPTNWRYMTGKAYLWYYKTAWLAHYRNQIKKYADEVRIPVLLLAGVAVAEVGGTPERFKSVGVLQFRQLIENILRDGDKTWSNSTSVGSIAIQIGVAARTINLRPDNLSNFQQFQLSQCLLNNDFNIKIAALHLRDLILFDNPGIDTSYLTDEQIILAGSRYNRGALRSKNDILQSIHAIADSPERQYSEYGRRIIEKKKAILTIMQGN